MVAAVCSLFLVFVKDPRRHRVLSYIMVVTALLGLVGSISAGNVDLHALTLHSIHVVLGILALLLSLVIFTNRVIAMRSVSRRHCRIGYLATGCACLALLLGGVLLSSGGYVGPPLWPTIQGVQVPASSQLPEVEATEFLNVTLTALSQQGNNAIKGTQDINVAGYQLSVHGLVTSPLSLSYAELKNLSAYSTVVYMPCVEGWGFTAKWTGFRVINLLDQAGLHSNATYVVFHSADGYSTGLSLEYLRQHHVLMAYGINDVTLPPERGFPFQLVAINKYGYKWAKWITSLQVVDAEVAGYWESRGYSNDADVGTYPFG
jgi:DMSO/TMAO reductase YedYZ molybdopterin-dependent catalytic subunit